MFLYHFFRIHLDVLSRLFLHLEVKGRDLVPATGGFVLASNHASLLDPLLLGVACPRTLNFAARDSLFANPLFASLIRKVGAFPLKRWSADISSIKESLRRLRQGFGLVVFPEGTRNSSGKPQKDISAGFAFLAQKAGVPVVPVWIEDSGRALGKGMKFIRPCKVRVRFGKPVYIRKEDDFSRLASEIYQRILQLAKSQTTAD